MTGNYLRLADRIHRELGNIETALQRAYRDWDDFQSSGYDFVSRQYFAEFTGSLCFTEFTDNL